MCACTRARLCGSWWTYTLYPMKFITCKISKGKNKKNFIINYGVNDLLPPLELDELRKKHTNLNSKTAEINFTDNKNLLGYELEYIENNKKYKGVLLTSDFNYTSYKNDILINFSGDSKIDTTSSCLLINDRIKCINDNNCKWFDQSCYNINDIISNNFSIAFNKL